jgi:regulator of cell morphogenesis and NO signaling
MKNWTNKTIGEIVVDNYDTAEVFQSLGIDFCCNGNRNLAEVCEQRNLEMDVVIEDLEMVMQQNSPSPTAYQGWAMDVLADHIEQKHHAYVEKQLPILNQYLEKIDHVHGKKHPMLAELRMLFQSSTAELAKHMKKEELLLFPYIRKMVQAMNQNEALQQPHFVTVKNPLEVMMLEHDTEGERFRKIRLLTNGYTLPDDACATWTAAYKSLEAFEADLHLHIHLENNILFPEALRIERQLRDRTRE